VAVCQFIPSVCACGYLSGRDYVMECHSVSVVALHFSVKYIKILSISQQCFYGKFMSPAAIKRT